jgi:DNA invertase Pin-like site-specific DNA recombinase
MKDTHDTKTVDLAGGVKLGYARVSTSDQVIDLQIDALKACGCADIYQEEGSGKKADRPQLQACLRALRAGDTLVVWRLDRLGRSISDLIKIVSDLEARGIGFASVTEQIDTSTAAGKLIFHMFAMLAEFERNLLIERTNAGLKAARARGRKGGRKPSLTDKQKKEVAALMRDRSISAQSIADKYGVSRATVYKVGGVT